VIIFKTEIEALVVLVAAFTAGLIFPG